MSGLHPNLKAALQDVLTEAELLGMGHAELAGILCGLGFNLVEAIDGRAKAMQWIARQSDAAWSASERMH